MPGPSSVRRTWIRLLVPEEVRLRCSYRRRGKKITKYTVQLEIYHGDKWRPVVRYDNAHGFCHCDTIHPDGTQEKTTVFIGDANENFTKAIEKATANWEAQRDRFVKESKND